MRRLPLRSVLVLTATTLLVACERSPAPQAPVEVPVPVVAPILPPAPVPAPPPPAPVQAAPPPAAREGRLPLTRILAIAQRRVPGEVIKVDLDDDDDDDDPPTYELEILTPEGRVMEIKLDARTGEILDVEED